MLHLTLAKSGSQFSVTFSKHIQHVIQFGSVSTLDNVRLVNKACSIAATPHLMMQLHAGTS